MNTWALILAGGEGRRLQHLTTTADGRAMPKQFCSLSGGMSLIEHAIERAQGVCELARVCAVVAEQHRPWWRQSLGALTPENIIVQPEGRGTLYGIMLPVLHILARDPSAIILVLPSDHYVQDEAILRRAMRRAIARAKRHPQRVFLLGMQPEEMDSELGYVVARLWPGAHCGPVLQFVEKPSAWSEISRLRLQGALWNSFIFAASANGLSALFPARFGADFEAMRTAVEQDRRSGTLAATRELYQQLASADFSREVLMGQETSLQLVPVPECGWSDLGTPTRLERTLRRLEAQPDLARGELPAAAPIILREQLDRLGRGSHTRSP